MPEEWSMEIIQPIYKKGDKLEFCNYRAITLLNVTYKVLSGILYNRLTECAEEILGECQGRYHVSPSTIDHIFTIRQTQEKAYEYNIHLHSLFINFKQAFDSVNRGRILSDLLILGIPKKLVQLINVTMTGSKTTVRVDNQYTSTFPITNGVRQGDALSSVLFDLVLEAIFQKINIAGHIGTKSTQILVYCDDVAIMSRSKSALKDTSVNIEKEAGRRGLLVNENKIKCMQVARVVPHDEHRCCGKHKFEHIKEFSYLGSQMNQTNSISNEIQARILSGNRCYCAYGKLMKSRALNRSSKLKMYRSLIRPVVTYGREAWTLTNQDEQHIRIFERRILRKIFGPEQNEDGSWGIRMNYELNKLIESAYIVRFIKSRRIAWLGHMLRMDDKRTPKRILEWKPIGTRNRKTKEEMDCAH
jgi:hypothetical protein